jgi:hypothetical protein
MRGFALLVVFGVACSSSAGSPEAQGTSDGGSGGAAGAKSQMAGAGSKPTQDDAGAGGALDDGQAGAQDSAGAPAGGDAGAGGTPDVDEPAAGGKAQGGATSSAGSHSGGSSGSGQGGAPANQCVGFTEYTIPANGCLVLSGEFKMQTDPVSCSAAGILMRDHCFTCEVVTATASSNKVLLNGATVKELAMSGGVCPSGCKYICN